MAVNNPFSITYAGVQVGGSSDTYQLLGPYVFEKSFDRLRLVFDVVVVTGSYSALQSQSDTLESTFRQRDQNLSISLSGSTWTYTNGTDTLNVTSNIVKSGNPDTDRGFSRAYTCTVEAELPADDNTGLRDVEVLVDFEAGRQKVVTMQGTYTALSGTDAVSQYQSDFDSEASTFLTAIDSSATFELVDESYTMDRRGSSSHLCRFFRQYIQLLEDQSEGSRDDSKIRDHRVVFTDLSQHPGDDAASVKRLRRVVGTYECALDIDQETDAQTLFDDTVRPHIVALFRSNFTPTVFAIEGKRISYDETSKRLSASINFIYQAEDGDAIVEVSQSVAYRESRIIDYTPVHNGDALAFDADEGWTTLERVWNRTVLALGPERPNVRISGKPRAGAAGLFVGPIGLLSGPDSGDNTKVRDGWNVISNTSQVSDRWIGDPTNEEQIQLSVLTEDVVERFNRRPSGGRTTAGGSSQIQ